MGVWRFFLKNITKLLQVSNVLKINRLYVNNFYNVLIINNFSVTH